MIGFSDVHTRAHLYRAILEGLAYALRDGAEKTAKRSGVNITELRVAGGGTQSSAAMQLTADIFGLPASKPHVYEASGLGAAMDAAVGSGVHADFKNRSPGNRLIRVRLLNQTRPRMPDMMNYIMMFTNICTHVCSRFIAKLERSRIRFDEQEER